MIALLRGTLVDKNPSRLIVEVAGVGYDVQVPLSTFYGLGEPGAEVALRVHTHVREDALAVAICHMHAQAKAGLAEAVAAAARAPKSATSWRHYRP